MFRTIRLAMAVAACLAGAGLPPAAGASAAQAQPSTSPGQPTPLTSAVAAALPGSRAGGFHFFSFAYPGDGSAANLILNFYPSDPGVTNGFGLVVFQDGQQISSLGGPANYCLGTLHLPVSSFSKSPMLVQLYNYVPNVTVSYTLMVAGPGPWPQPPWDNRQPRNAVPFPDLTTGSVPGDPGGSYHFYLVTPSAVGQPLNLSLTFFPFDNVTANGFGMNLYRGGLLVASANVPYTSAQLTSCGRTSMLTYTPTSPEPLLVQVFNYTPNWTVQYTLAKVYQAAPTA